MATGGTRGGTTAPCARRPRVHGAGPRTSRLPRSPRASRSALPSPASAVVASPARGWDRACRRVAVPEGDTGRHPSAGASPWPSGSSHPPAPGHGHHEHHRAPIQPATADDVCLRRAHGVPVAAFRRDLPSGAAFQSLPTQHGQSPVLGQGLIFIS